MSLWGKYQDDFHFPSLHNDKEVDVLIIGGGIVGLTALYYLRNYFSICLVEKNTIGCGVSKNTTGKLTYLQSAIHVDLEKNINRDVAKSYLQSQIYAISLLRKIIEKERIFCDLEKVDSFLHADKEKDISKLNQEKIFLQESHIEVKEEKNAISVEDTYVFNPIKYLNGLKSILKEKDIYEHTNIFEITYKNNKYHCKTPSGTIFADKVIVACHYPFFLFPFCLPFKSHIEKSYLIAYKTDKNELCSGITVSNPGYSYRYYQDENEIVKICLARSHHTAVKQNDQENFLRVKEIFSIPEDKIVEEWSNVDIITDDMLPYIGQVKPNFYIATGFNTWGMTNGILASKIIADEILGKKNSYAELFKTNRMDFYKVKSFFENMGGTICAFINSRFKKKWYPKNLHFEKRNGKTIAIYIDQKKKKHIVVPTCPHMKCGLLFNAVEKTWDCPCHSSRFDLDGNCIKGPSTENISYKK